MRYIIVICCLICVSCGIKTTRNQIFTEVNHNIELFDDLYYQILVQRNSNYDILFKIDTINIKITNEQLIGSKVISLPKNNKKLKLIFNHGKNTTP